MSDPLKVYKGDTATRLVFNTGVVLTGATNLKIFAKKPNGVVEEWPAEIVSGEPTKMRCTEPAGFFDASGIWRFHGFADLPGSGSIHGELCSIRIYELWE